MAYSFVSNTSVDTTALVFFRIASKNNQAMKAASLEDVWLQFAAAQAYIEHHSKKSTTATSSAQEASSAPTTLSAATSTPTLSTPQQQPQQTFAEFDLLNLNATT
jgi:hypothetical protein